MPNRGAPEVIAQLTAGIAELTSSSAWRAWLAAQSRFHSYSFGNCLLIARQRPEATHVAGFHTWRSLGRHVLRGERGIWILAPMTRRAGGDDDEAAARVLIGFRAVAVFDVAQTAGEPLPELPAHVLRGAAPNGAYERLLAAAPAIGYTVLERELPDGRNGDCTFATRTIRIEPANDTAQRAKTLAHELAHALLHEHCSQRALAELEAESVAHVVCDALGIQSGGYSFAYVARWAGGGGEAIAAIRAAGERIQRTAHLIIEAASPPSGSTSRSPHAAAAIPR